MPTPADATTIIALDAVAAPASSTPQYIGGWLVQRRLGAGAMGEVFLAERGTQRAALKLVAKRFAGDAAFIARFQREIALLATFDHVNVARALDGGDHEGRPWLAMEYVNGPDLDSLLKEHGPFFESDVVQAAMQIARGLDHIHQHAGLIHRDVKPANVLIHRAPGGDPNRLLNPGDHAKLIDFGLAKPVEQDEGNGLTMTGMILGTPNYIAPEQVACERHLTLHVDMYALGATMFHLLTGRVPFERSSAAAVMAAHLNDAVPDPGQLVPAVSPATRRLIMTTLAKRPGERFADWRAFLIACEKALAALGEKSGASTTNRFLKKPLTRPPTTSATRKVEGATGQTSKPVTAILAKVDVPASGADALRAAVASRIARTSPPSGQHAKPETRRQDPATSAVSTWSGRHEAASATGGTILPWVVLGLACALAIAGAVWALLAL